MRFALFVVVVLTLLSGIHVVLHRRMAHAFDLGPRARRVLGFMLAAGLVSVVASRFLASVGRPAEGFSAALGLFGFTVALDALLSFVLMLPIEPLRWWARWRRAKTKGEAPPDTSRRDAIIKLGTATAVAVGGSASLFGTLVGRHDYTVEEVPLQLAKLPRTLDGFTIAQLSDVHVGTYVTDSELRAGVDLVRGIRPDLIVLTGDLVDFDPRYSDLLGRFVARLAPLATYGVAAILGNHDYYANPEVVKRVVRRGGASMLINEARPIGDAGGRFSIVGVDDMWAQRSGGTGGPDLARALAMTRPDDATILLAHTPAFFPEAAGRIDVQLCGHTHGGQVALGWNPANLVLPYGYVAGRYERSDSVLYVNRGFGTAGPPSRIEAAPEVTKIVLVSG
jgi:predicted MPP superfamily phosphohydrolase